MRQKLLIKAIKYNLAAILVLLLNWAIDSGRLLFFTLPGIALVLFIFAIYYLIKAARYKE